MGFNAFALLPVSAGLLGRDGHAGWVVLVQSQWDLSASCRLLRSFPPSVSAPAGPSASEPHPKAELFLLL